jgi:hypothetical protein
MGTATLFGLMAKSISESSLRTNATATENSSGRMAANTTVSGSKENSMGLAFTEMLREKTEEASGRMEKELAGWISDFCLKQFVK